MIRTLSAFAATILILSSAVQSGERLRMSTTTSTESSGLLAALLPPFERANGCTVNVIAVGTGKALKLGEAGDVDVVFVHARELEDRFVAQGHGIDRKDVMYNDFVLLGPRADPAKVSGAVGPADALRRIAASKALFISRGDESGTHRKEQELWRAAGIVPKGSWYREAGQGMGEVLEMAFQKRGYTLSDRGTYVAFRTRIDLAILFQGDAQLRNPYGVIAVSPARHPHVRYGLARKFTDFLTGPEGQRIIAEYRIAGEPLFFPAMGAER
ncbi:MAG: tungsten ABC transporter substrate-binding protein [Deltaproteobacteria bacterium GWC2_65_14]|nr:MAG: tungsten ABC transporter substrate-binding protein [Deltaproteobacteria bacterium GWC2_65_14]